MRWPGPESSRLGDLSSPHRVTFLRVQQPCPRIAHGKTQNRGSVCRRNGTRARFQSTLVARRWLRGRSMSGLSNVEVRELASLVVPWQVADKSVMAPIEGGLSVLASPGGTPSISPTAPVSSASFPLRIPGSPGSAGASAHEAAQDFNRRAARALRFVRERGEERPSVTARDYVVPRLNVPPARLVPECSGALASGSTEMSTAT